MKHLTLEILETAIFPIRWSVTPRIVAWFLRRTGGPYDGWRFDSSWRHAETGYKAFVYRWLLCTFHANIIADTGKAIPLAATRGALGTLSHVMGRKFKLEVRSGN